MCGFYRMVLALYYNFPKAIISYYFPYNHPSILVSIKYHVPIPQKKKIFPALKGLWSTECRQAHDEVSRVSRCHDANTWALGYDRLEI
jgi:hypothetical protein